MTVIYRRRKLGRTSCREIKKSMTSPNVIISRSDRPFPAPEGHALAIRWGCTGTIPIRNVLNTAEAIHEVNNKIVFRRKLEAAELCPKTWFDYSPENRFVFPLIVRSAKHAQGRNLVVVNNQEELETACKKFLRGPTRGFYISEIIDKVAEYRVFVVQGRAVCVAKKTPSNPEDIAWNVAQGGRFDNVLWGDWPLKAVRIAIEGFLLSSLDFGGVDVMVDANGQCYILEINSAPSLTSEYRQQCFAKAFDYIIENGKERIPLIGRRGGYRKFIHPAITNTAYLLEDAE